MGIGLGNPLTEFTPHLFLSDFEAMGAKRGVHRDSPFSTLPKARRAALKSCTMSLRTNVRCIFLSSSVSKFDNPEATLS